MQKISIACEVNKSDLTDLTVHTEIQKDKSCRNCNNGDCQENNRQEVNIEISLIDSQAAHIGPITFLGSLLTLKRVVMPHAKTLAMPRIFPLEH